MMISMKPSISSLFAIMERLKNWSVEKIGGTSLWRVVTPFLWYIDYEDKEWWVVIAEKDFVFNYWSIPRIFRIFFDPTRYNSYCLHDAMYTDKRMYHIGNDEYTPMTRKEADKILLEWIRYEWAWFFERLLIYLGVRLFGWIAWE